MIEHVTLKYFRCFKDVAVELRPFTVLIGPNDSGKTTFLTALQRLPQGARQGDKIADMWRGTHQGLITAHAGGNRITAGSSHDGPRENLTPLRLFTLPPSGVSLTSGGTVGVPTLDQDGGNVAALVDYFVRKDRARFDRFVAAMRDRVPGLEDINVETPSAEQRQVEFKVDGGFIVRGDHVSAGVRLLTFFLALAHHPTPPKVVLIEEPENGLHPKRLVDVVRLLRGLAHGSFGGSRAQVIVTTHSPLVLDEVDLNADQVLVFQRDSSGDRTAQAVDRDRLKVFLEEFKLGEVWINKDEQALVKKASGS